MVELVDTADLKSAGVISVRVRIPLRAIIESKRVRLSAVALRRRKSLFGHRFLKGDQIMTSVICISVLVAMNIIGRIMIKHF